ncbi:Ig-like domain-containing protein [Candidatus Avoscillospira sp. LCP25S3_F1]|uniref:Ig-like domain-containing protein n=1 Tax=Candidatus Avoscillospira sp. LCP25S3_F1 TaxID=3438825 RepID=UPI003F92CF20
MARITCDYCGTEYDDIQQRCPLCGSINQSDPAQTESGAHGQKARGGRYSTLKAAHSSRSNKATQKDVGEDDRIPKWLTIMICVVLGLAVVIGALYAMYAVGIFSPQKTSSEDLTLPEQQITEDIDQEQDTQQTEDQEQIVQPETTPAEVLCTGITLSERTVTLESAGLATTVTATAQPADCTETILWTSSDTTVCTVDDLGIITAVDGGKATVTATCGSFSAEVEVVCNFSNSKENNAYLSTTDFTLFSTGEVATIQVLDAPEGATITWSSSNAGVCTVSGGKVTAVKAGTATVTAQVNDKKLTCTVRCNIEGSVVANDSNAENTGGGSTGGNQLDHTDVTLSVGQSFEISVVNGVSGGWNVTDGSVISVDGNGNVTALASGTAKVYTTVNGQRLECIVRVP